ncbi:class II glutamine amidotransferase [Sneathiella marina]|uniref:Class II glutamine amidotransferase n=1 Tax=Sneathiella marina TaxID=2950108 RepID=A0ABY4W7X8_9PROT|nr:class II glutamine amidotransferase [Sneathiella marina]USG63127.1 class II glutamine amidotransferase [Sneathiella marina]
MCELFAVSSLNRVAVDYSLHEFSQHGGLSHLNKSGWGMSFQQDLDTLLIKEAMPAFDSAWVKFIHDQHLSSKCILAHVRYATKGEPVFENTHPFKREAFGRAHVFAHNGSLNEFQEALPLRSSTFLPMGQTDSEHAFCYLLNELSGIWESSPPSVDQRLKVLSVVALKMRALGSANFLYSDGDMLFAHADKRRFDSEGTFGPNQSPALHWIARRDFKANGIDLKSQEGSKQKTLLLASVPLSDDNWQGLPRGTIIAVKSGRIVDQIFIGEST